MRLDYLRLFWAILSLATALFVHAQNFENVRVDELSDAQIRSFLKQAEESGYTESQLEVLARARGMSATEIQKLRQRIQQLQPDTTTGSARDVERMREGPDEKAQQGEDPFTSFQKTPKDQPPASTVFGRNIFNNPNLSFQPSFNIPTPENYLLGPGDELIIDVWGASEQNYQVTISPEGAIRIPSVGPIYLNGLTIEAGRQKILNRLKGIYSSLGQNTFAEVSLGQLKSIKVNIVGEVAAPGTYTLSSFSTVYNALYLAGGTSENGTLRAIRVFRNGQLVEEVDIYEFLFNAKPGMHILRDQDVILVRPFQARVQVAGEVKRPMMYELKPDETLADLISYAGGFTDEAYRQSLSLRRVTSTQREIVTVRQEDFETTTLRNGDRVMVGQILDEFTNRIVIEGAVYRAGEYELTEGMMLSDLLDKAQGVEPDAFMERGLLLREKADKTIESIAFSVAELVSGDWDIALRPDDFVKIQSQLDLRNEYNITVQGQVRAPGTIPYADSLTVEDVILLSGGFREAAARSFVEVARRITSEAGDGSTSAEIYNFPIDANLNLSSDASDFILAPYDLVVIRSSPFYEKQIMVEVEGEVQYPGKYALERKNERISSVLERSGGLSQYAYTKGATLIRRTEYYNGDDMDNEDTDAAIRLRREELTELFQRDTLAQGRNVFKEQESIGIELDEILKSPGGKHDLILREGDILSIPRELQTVRIRGEVLYPSTVRYDDLRSFRQFISRAGGFTDEAKKSKAYIVYANGAAARTRQFLWIKDYPKVEPGAEIIIPTKPERRKLSPGEIIGLTSGVATLSLVVLRLVDYMSEDKAPAN